MASKILVIDDEEQICLVLDKSMRQEGYKVLTANSSRQGLELIMEENPSLIIMDLMMPGMGGMGVLKRAKEMHPKTPVIILTAHSALETAIEAMKIGAADFITKPFDLDELKIVVKKALKISQLASEVSFLRSELTRRYDQVIGQSKAIKDLRVLVDQVAASNATVLITGESGTGKEVVAVSIHQASPRRDAPFVAVNSAALPEHLLESELFGHEKGAFTGAVARKLGRFEMADRGTIFLDEIAEMSLNMQAKLLRILQEKTFERVGGTETLKVDVRVIAATNRNLSDAIAKGAFREDLYYRLNVIPIHLPPLRERREDIPLLVEHLLEKFQRIYPVNRVNPFAMKILSKYHWPGNIRELQNVIERGAIICQGSEIMPDHLPMELQLLKKENEGDGLVINFPEGGISLEEVEKQLILKAIEKSEGNQTKAARLLGITRSALLYRIRKHRIV